MGQIKKPDTKSIFATWLSIASEEKPMHTAELCNQVYKIEWISMHYKYISSSWGQKSMYDIILIL